MILYFLQFENLGYRLKKKKQEYWFDLLAFSSYRVFQKIISNFYFICIHASDVSLMYLNIFLSLPMCLILRII